MFTYELGVRIISCRVKQYNLNLTSVWRVSRSVSQTSSDVFVDNGDGVVSSASTKEAEADTTTTANLLPVRARMSRPHLILLLVVGAKQIIHGASFSHGGPINYLQRTFHGRRFKPYGTTFAQKFHSSTSLQGRGGKNDKGPEKKVKKENLPEKICVVCKRPFTWRKKWERSWDEITCCSKACNGQRRSGNNDE
jgi:hypothetical protein